MCGGRANLYKYILIVKCTYNGYLEREREIYACPNAHYLCANFGNRNNFFPTLACNWCAYVHQRVTLLLENGKYFSFLLWYSVRFVTHDLIFSWCDCIPIFGILREGISIVIFKSYLYMYTYSLLCIGMRVNFWPFISYVYFERIYQPFRKRLYTIRNHNKLSLWWFFFLYMVLRRDARGTLKLCVVNGFKKIFYFVNYCLEFRIQI